MELLIALSLATTLSVPGRAAATPSIAARESLVVVAFSAADPDGATDIYAAVSRDAGRTFGAPVRVNDTPGDARVNGEQPPRVEIASDAIVVVWTSKGRTGTRLLQARSADGGRTFARASVVPGSDAAGNRGWESIAGPFALWLDHRELAATDSTVAMQHMHAGGESLTEKSKLYFGSLDGTLPPRAVAAGVCYCCKTALAIDASGQRVYAAWRHVFPGSVRDIAFAMSSDRGRTFSTPGRVSDDHWVLQGCPENGPALAVDPARHIHIVWPTLLPGDGGASDDNLALFYARSSDGRSFTPRRPLPTEGLPRHPQIAVAPDGSLLVAWDEAAAGKRHAIVTRATVGDDGAATFTRTVLGEGVYPAVAWADGATVVAWTSGGGNETTVTVDRP